MQLSLILLFVLVLLALFILGMILWGLKHAVALAVNSLIGFFALYALRTWLLPSLLINVWSVLIVAVFGIFGLVVVVLSHILGVLF